MLKLVSLSVLGTLAFAGSAWASVEWKDKLYQQSNGRVVQSVKTEKGTWAERVSLPDEGEDSFYELWCRHAEGYCPQGVADKIKEAEQLFSTYDYQSANAKTALARQRAKSEAKAASEVRNKFEADREFLAELVDDYLKAPVPFHFEGGTDKAYIDIVSVWSEIFEQAVANKRHLERLANLNLSFACVAYCDGEFFYSKNFFKHDEQRACRASLKEEKDCKEEYSFLFAPYLDSEKIRRESQEFKKNPVYWKETGIVSEKAEENELSISYAKIGRAYTSSVDLFDFRQFSNKAVKLLCEHLRWDELEFIYFQNSKEPMEITSVYRNERKLRGASCEDVFTHAESSQVLPKNTELDFKNYNLTAEDISRFKTLRGY